ncbi:MAG: large repetitive protein [Thermoanaerobaculia bacterium]|jgi:hypothetical protein|nr:large repetitive protein [Thermoanaerobaculia bacterium]
MSSEDRRVLAVVGFVALCCCCSSRALAQSAPSLGNAASFAVLGGSSVTNSGPTVVTGNLGVSPGNTIVGFFPPGVVQLGDIQGKALSQLAQHDAGIAYGDLASVSRPCTTLSPVLGDATLPPITTPPTHPPVNVYCVDSPAQLKGPLIFDAGGNHDTVWIFRITGSFTTDHDSSILAINGAQPGNIFWQVSGSATLEAGSAFVGNLLAHDNITLNSTASVFGRVLALTGTVTLNTNNVLLCTNCNAINLDPPVLPDGEVDKLYTQTTIRASGGTEPYTFKVISGSLPLGLSLTPGGVLSGTPMESGSFPITVAATDSQGCSGERKYTIAIIPCAITLSPPALLPATACVHYQQSITAMGCSGSYVYKFAGLPDGLIPNFPNQGDISGFATTPGPYNVTVTATDTVTGSFVSGTYPLTVICNVMISPATLPGATACTPYSQTLTGSCGTAKYTFSVPDSTLPDGLTLSPEGLLCGTPTTPGDTTFTVTATDAKFCTGSRTYTLKVACNVTISPLVLRNGSVNTPYSEQLTASCGTPQYTFTKVPEPFPPGSPALTLSTDGLLSGTPTAAGVYQFRVTATDSAGCTGTRDYTLFICPLTISPATLPNGIVGVQYGQPIGDQYGHLITANNGSGLYRFSVPPGTLPPGLTLNPMSPVSSQTALISGKPTTSGTFTFTVTATDALSGCIGSQTYTIVVNCNLALFPATLPAAELGSLYYKTIIASGGTPPYTFSATPTIPPPPGLTFNTANGVISGTPTALGSFSFCITVTDTSTPPCTATQCYTIDVIPPLVGGPTLSAWGMLLLSILLAGAGLIVIRRDG